MEEIIRQLQIVRAEIDTLSRLVYTASREEEKSPEAPEGREDGLLDIRDLTKRYKVSAATIYRWIRDGRFPAGVALGPKTRRWREGDMLGYPNRH